MRLLHLMSLFSSYKFGGMTLRNRMVMEPMTRCRADEGNIPGPLAVTYYTRRASAGLIVTEGSQVSPKGVGFDRTPGIYSPEQVAGWKKITRAVHKEGSGDPCIFYIGKERGYTNYPAL